MSDTENTGIINVNDFIFKQNLEFYPNLEGLSCEDNKIIYRQNGEIINKVTLTFDLRTLPGNAWNVSPDEFIDIIKLNKDCTGLYEFINLMQQHGFDNFIKPQFMGSEG